MKKLYRYIGFEDFVNLFINNKERYVRPSSWEDEYEGYLFTHMETEEDVHNIVRYMYNELCVQNYDAIPNNYCKMWHAKWFTYAQCWSRQANNDAMWKCYSYGNKAIRIKTREDKLETYINKIFPKQEKYSVYLKKISYDMNKNFIFEQQMEQIKENKFTYESYFHKRHAFRHEEEYRVIVVDNRLYDITQISIWGIKYNIIERIKGKTDDEIIEYLSNQICTQRAEWKVDSINNIRLEEAGNISEYIEGVMVHPKAPMWYVDIVRDICKLRNIKFEGRSEIYKLK